MHGEAYLLHSRQVFSAYQQETIPMHTTIRRTLITLTLALAPALAPVAAHANPLHLHPNQSVPQSARYTFTIYNNTAAYEEFKVQGVTHVVPSHCSLLVTAPAGTEIYAASKMGNHPRGSLLFSVTPQYDSQKIVVE
jgi:hypothetical protein